jgi:hypothetical protein
MKDAVLRRAVYHCLPPRTHHVVLVDPAVRRLLSRLNSATWRAVLKWLRRYPGQQNFRRTQRHDFVIDRQKIAQEPKMLPIPGILSVGRRSWTEEYEVVGFEAWTLLPNRLRPVA